MSRVLTLLVLLCGLNARAGLLHSVPTLSPNPIAPGAIYEVADCGLDPTLPTLVYQAAPKYAYVLGERVNVGPDGCFDELYFYAPYEEGSFTVYVKQKQQGHAYYQVVGRASLEVAPGP